MSLLNTGRRGGRSQSRVTLVHVLAAAALLGLLLMPVAFARVGAPVATKSGSLAKQIKKLKRRVTALEAKSGQVGRVPASLPPSGPAGGDLAGDYPNPTISPRALSAFPRVSDSIAAGDLSGTYSSPELRPGVVGTAEFGTIPAVRVYNSTSQTVPGGSAFTFLSFDSEQFDTADMHSTSSNTETLTAPVSGIYEVGATIQLAIGGTIDNPTPSVAAIILASNGARVNDSETLSLATNTSLNLSGVIELSAGDTVKLEMVDADNDSATVFGNAGAGIPALSMDWIGPPEA